MSRYHTAGGMLTSGEAEWMLLDDERRAASKPTPSAKDVARDRLLAFTARMFGVEAIRAHALGDPTGEYVVHTRLEEWTCPSRWGYAGPFTLGSEAYPQRLGRDVCRRRRRYLSSTGAYLHALTQDAVTL